MPNFEPQPHYDDPDPDGCVCPQDYVATRCPVHDPDGTFYDRQRVSTLGNIERYGIAGRAAGNAVLQHGRDGARLRPASDAFLLSRIARAVVDALDDHDQGAVSDRDKALRLLAQAQPGPALQPGVDQRQWWDEASALLRAGGR